MLFYEEVTYLTVRREIRFWVTLKTTVVWNLMAYGVVEMYRCFSETYCCHPHGT
jgi:hypothetical protein